MWGTRCRRRDSFAEEGKQTSSANGCRGPLTGVFRLGDVAMTALSLTKPFSRATSRARCASSRTAPHNPKHHHHNSDNNNTSNSSDHTVRQHAEGQRSGRHTSTYTPEGSVAQTHSPRPASPADGTRPSHTTGEHVKGDSCPLQCPVRCAVRNAECTSHSAAVETVDTHRKAVGTVTMRQTDGARYPQPSDPNVRVSVRVKYSEINSSVTVRKVGPNK